MAKKAASQQSTGPALRIYPRRSKADDGHQQFSLDVQREGSHMFVVDALPRFGLSASWLIASSTSTTTALAMTSWAGESSPTARRSSHRRHRALPRSIAPRP